LKVRRLSKLQRLILELTGAGPGDYHQLTTREIMIKLYGWTPARTPNRAGGISFDVEMIGAGSTAGKWCLSPGAWGG
jgi:hypothetical protein